MSGVSQLDDGAARSWSRVMYVRVAVLATILLATPILPDLNAAEQGRLAILLGLVALPYNVVLAVLVRQRRTLHPVMTFVDLAASAVVAWQVPHAAAGSAAVALSHLALGVVLFGRRWSIGALVFGTVAMTVATQSTENPVNAGLVGFGAAGVVLIATINFLQAREREASTRFASLVDGLDAVVWEFDVSEGAAPFVSRQAATIVGWEPDDSRTVADWLDRVVPDDAGVIRAHLARVMENGEDVAEYRITRMDGSVLWLRDTATVERNTQGEVVSVRGVAVDVSAEHAASVALEQYADIVGNMQLSLMVWELVDRDDTRSVTARTMNPAAITLFARTPEETIGHRLIDLYEGDPLAQAFCRSIAHTVISQERRTFDSIPYRRADGSEAAFSMVMIPLPGDCVAVICEDVSERWRAQDELRHQALHDSLTGLPNRALLQDRLTTALAAAKRTSTEVALLLMDLDQFKEINDTLGHLTGDRMLAQVGVRLSELLRDCDTVARLGGDEFAVLLTVDADREGAGTVAQRIIETLAEPFELDGIHVQASASIGIALSPEHGTDPETIVQRADIAMYKAKRGGRGFAFYATHDDHTSLRRLTLVGELRRAIEGGELELHYQPKVDLRGGEVVGVEALIRWRHPAQGLLPPGDFIPLAEVSGLIQPLTRWVVAESLQQSARWEIAGRSFPVAVNVSARNLYDPGLVRGIGDELAATGVPPDRLVLELTESELVEDPSQVMTVLSLVSGMGVGLAIDDFGTGWSSLSNLTRLPIQEVKIDRSFVMGMLLDRDDEVIVRSIVDLGHNLGLNVVAEGVERQPVLDALRQLGCDQAQGYFVCPPVPATELDEWLLTRGVGSLTLP